MKTFALQSEREFARIEEDGYVLLRGVFSESEVAVMADAFDRLIDRASGHTHTTMIDGSQFVVDLDENDIQRIHRVVWCGAAEPSLLAIGRDARLLEIARSFLGVRTFDHLINQAHFKYPGDGVEFPFHQDSIHRRYGTPLWTDVDGHGSFVQIATAVDPMTLENGPLKLIPGSHLGGHIEVDPQTRALPDDAFDPADVVTLELEPGDVVAWSPFLIHGSEPNQSDVPRRLFINGFATPGANHRVYPGEGSGKRIHWRTR